eukprot:scaffold1352_cov180-Amphora_coffeaeformis.AAC.8
MMIVQQPRRTRRIDNRVGPRRSCWSRGVPRRRVHCSVAPACRGPATSRNPPIRRVDSDATGKSDRALPKRRSESTYISLLLVGTRGILPKLVESRDRPRVQRPLPSSSCWCVLSSFDAQSLDQFVFRFSESYREVNCLVPPMPRQWSNGPTVAPKRARDLRPRPTNLDG